LTAQTGSSTPLKTGIFLSSNDACLVHNFTATASSAGGWLSVTPASGTVSATYGNTATITADPTGKPDGTYTGTITITSPTASNSPISIPVTLKIGPILTVSPNSFLTFGAAQGNPPPAPQGLLVSAGAAIPFTVTSTTSFGGNWLIATPASGNTTAGSGGADVMVSVDPTGLAAGFYSGFVTISSTQSLGSPVTVSVSLTVGPQLSVGTTRLTFTQAPGGAAPPAQTISLSTGVASVGYTAQAVSSTGWLSVTPTLGATPASLTVTANAASLPAGNYTGVITINAVGAVGSPVNVIVSLTVTQSMTLSPTGLFFTGLGPPDQAIIVSANTQLSNLTASPSSTGWLSVSPGLGASFIVSVNPAGLSPGSYSGFITIAAAGVTNSPQTVSVSLSVPQTTLLSPANASVSVPLSPTLTWAAITGATSYDVYVGTSSPPPFAANVTGTSYSPVGLSGTMTYYWRVVANSGNASSSSATWSFGTTTSAVALRFVPVAPCRVADTRNATGAFGGPQIGGGASRSFIVPNSACGIPATAQAYSLNVAVVPTGPLGFLTVWPSGQSQPVASTLNSLDGRVKSNAAIVPAGIGGGVNVFASNATHVILDINGYFVPATDPAGLAFYPVTPCRVADTRNAAASLGGPSLASGQARSFPVLAGTCNIPPTAQAYSLNFAAVPKGPLGFITAWATGQSQPVASTLNAPTGAVAANAAIVPAGASGAISIFASNATDLVIDINGYFAPMTTGGLSLYNVTPCRVLDTRSPSGAAPFSGKRDVSIAGGACGMPVVPAYVLSATVVPPSALGFLTLWPQAQTQPLVSTLNAIDGAVTSNLAIVPATTGSSSAFASNATHLVLDIFGHFGQ
jgi:hypothetical protein